MFNIFKYKGLSKILLTIFTKFNKLHQIIRLTKTWYDINLHSTSSIPLAKFML